jgi:hypothetical protein
VEPRSHREARAETLDAVVVAVRPFAVTAKSVGLAKKRRLKNGSPSGSSLIQALLVALFTALIGAALAYVVGVRVTDQWDERKRESSSVVGGDRRAGEPRLREHSPITACFSVEPSAGVARCFAPERGLGPVPLRKGTGWRCGGTDKPACAVAAQEVQHYVGVRTLSWGWRHLWLDAQIVE